MSDTIGIIGVGKLGICLALTLEKAGFNILCYDINSSLLDSIQEKTYISNEPFVNDLLENAKNINITKNIIDIFNLNTIFILVATPSLPNDSYDHSAIDKIIDNYLYSYNRLKDINIKRNIIIASTVMPQYCNSIQEKVDDLNTEIIYNPEFIAQGSIIIDMVHPDMVLIGSKTKEGLEIIKKIYNKFIKNTPVYSEMSLLEAEITKIALNCFITTKITFANIIGDIVKYAGGNPNNVLNAIGSDSRIGKKCLNWGFGYGGPCFPRDNRALNFFARSQNLLNEIGEATDSSNKKHLNTLLYLIKNKLQSKNKSIVFTSLSYKTNSIIIEESQQLQIAIELIKSGYNVIIKERDEVKDIVIKHYPEILPNFVNSLDSTIEYVYIDSLLQS